MDSDGQKSSNETSERKEVNPKWHDGYENWVQVYDLAMSYYHGTGDTLQDYPKAMKLLQQAVNWAPRWRASAWVGCIGPAQDVRKTTARRLNTSKRQREGGWPGLCRNGSYLCNEKALRKCSKMLGQVFLSNTSTDSQSPFNRGQYGCDYFTQAWEGLPLRHQVCLAQIKDEILGFANKDLERIQNKKLEMIPGSFWYTTKKN